MHGGAEADLQLAEGLGNLEGIPGLQPPAGRKLNPERRDDLSESPTKAIISLKNDRGTAYGTYLEVYNELRAAYNEIWDTEARKRYGMDYEDVPIANKRAIRADFPLIISEAEPTNFGEE